MKPETSSLETPGGHDCAAPPAPLPAREQDPRIPRHVAIVMDGNGRWAASRGKPRTMGHLRGSEVATEVYRACRRLGVKHLTLYGFSLANWQRPQAEVDALMALFASYAARLRSDFVARGIRLRIIGDLGSLPGPTRRSLEATAEATADQTGMTLSLAIAYGGRHDLLQAARILVARARAGQLRPEEVNATTLRDCMTTAALPDPDLLIRTGGELRLSDYLTFESAYTELVFSPVLWPDFGEAELRRAFEDYAGRERRFGRIRGASTPATTAIAAATREV